MTDQQQQGDQQQQQSAQQQSQQQQGAQQGDQQGQQQQQSQQAQWPSDWRQRLAADDADALKTLERFAEPPLLWKSYAALRQKVSSGELKPHTPFPDKGTAEEQANWRKEQGIPDKPEAYDLNLANGVVVGEEDKPLVSDYLTFAHANHTPGDVVKKNLEWFLGDYREKVEQQYAEREANMLKESEDTLRADWGNDYRPNMNAIQGLLDANVSADSGLKERILKSIKLEPEFAKLWANIARQINPMATLLPGDFTQQAKTVDERIAQIETTMRANRNAYNKDEKMQAEYRQLLDRRERLKGQTA